MHAFVLPLMAASSFLAAPPDTTELNKLFNDYYESELEQSPLQATYRGDHRYDDKLEDYSLEARRARLLKLAGFRRTIAHFDLSQLEGQDKLNAQLFEFMVSDEIEQQVYPSYLTPIRQQDGPHLALAMMLLSHPFKTVQDYENYNKRLRAFGPQTEHVIARMREGIERRVTVPNIIMKAVLTQLTRHVVDDVSRSEFYKPVATMPESFSAEDRKRLTDEIAQSIKDVVIPSYRSMATYVENDYLPACAMKVSLNAQPNGTSWYRALIRHHVTTQMTPEEIHAIGMAELKTIHAQMRQIMKKVGFDGTLQEFAAHLRSRSDMHAKSAEELISGHAAILKRSDALLPKLFGRLPKSPYELKAIESFRAPEAPMAYYYPAPEVGERPAYFYVNVYQPEKRPKYSMESLAYHEAMPGHHLQVSLAQENKNIPHFRRYAGFTVFVEGWGLYSESLGSELGGYQDPYSDYGRLTFDAWRSCRLVVDTGIHCFGWDRQKAIDFMKDNTSMTELDIIAEVDRYIAWPGQALGYKIGQLAILELRYEAEKRHGDRFDIRAFHDELLSEGALPLDLLKKRMHDWMDRFEKQAK